MEVLKIIEERRSIRNFKNDNVNKELIEDILNCGRLALSAKNKQPWYFVILTNYSIIYGYQWRLTYE